MLQTDIYPNELTVNSRTIVRCVNLDWLEVHCREPIGVPHNADYFRNQGFVVHEREYGTRVYREMFVLDGTDGEALLEIRRNPASSGLNGIHDENECHIRFTNRACYFDGAAGLLQTFLNNYGYIDVRISRIDLCMDFTTFDKGDKPYAFVRRYFRHKYAKINQGRICGHGDDTWSGQEWNSLSWGSKTSAVSTKMYNKTLELHDIKSDTYKKPYIRQAWQICGLIDDMHRVQLKGEKVDVWRVEFSLRSAVKHWVAIELDGNPKKYQSLHNNLDVYDSRDKILVMFASLANHYFHFKKYVEGQRKDRCPDKILFDFQSVQTTYKVGTNAQLLGSGNIYKPLYQQLINKLKLYRSTHVNPDIFKACEVLIASMSDEDRRSDLVNPWAAEQREMLQRLLDMKSSHKDMTFEVAMNLVRELLDIKERTIKPF